MDANFPYISCVYPVELAYNAIVVSIAQFLITFLFLCYESEMTLNNEILHCSDIRPLLAVSFEAESAQAPCFTDLIGVIVLISRIDDSPKY